MGELTTVLVLEPKIGSQRGHELCLPVHSEHAWETRRFYGRVRRFARVFVISMLLGCAAPFVFLGLRWPPGSSATLIYLGIILWLFPFCTPTTVEMIGVRNSVRLARASAALFVAGGVLLLFF